MIYALNKITNVNPFEDGKSAEEVCKEIKNDVLKASALTNACQSMINQYNKITDEQTQYELELDNLNGQMKELQLDAREKLEAIIERIDELKKKQSDGTITESEEAELQNKTNEYNTLMGNTNSAIKTKTTEVYEKGNQIKSSYKAKIQIASDYGRKTVEIGKPLSETEVKNTWWKRLWGKTGKDKKEAGEKALKVGNTLLEKVDDSENLNSKIAQKESVYKR